MDDILVSDDWREGWIRAADGSLMSVRYANVGGWAVFEGGIILDTTEHMENVADRIRRYPEIVTQNRLDLLGLRITNPGNKWQVTGQFYEVAYEVSPDLANVNLVKSAMTHWEANTKIRFKRRTGQAHYISIVPENYCASHVGRQQGQQNIWLSANCSEGNVIHEIGHAVGLWHEHSRPDRDDFIEVVAQNVDPRARYNFDKQAYNAQAFGAYDFGSIMHYSGNAFSLNGQPTIRPKPGNGDPEFGQRKALSAGDIATVNALYP